MLHSDSQHTQDFNTNTLPTYTALTHTLFFFLKEQSLQEVVTKLIVVNGLATWKVTVKNYKTIVKYV